MNEPNDPRNLMAVGMVTALLHEDKDAFYASSNFDGGCPEALTCLGHVTVAIIKMMAELMDPPMTPEQVWAHMAKAIAIGGDG
jgi:hypothetical protein